RCRNERAIFSAQRSTGLAEISAAARTVDGPREAIHGISPARDTAFSNLRPRRATRTRWRNLGELLFVNRGDRLLDERRVHFADRVGSKANSHHLAHARTLARQRRLFYRRQ